MVLMLLILLGGVSSQYTTGKVPEPLVRSHEFRADFQTARFRFVSEYEWPGVQAKSTSLFEAECSHDDLSWTNYGDEDGVVLRQPASGQPMLGVMHACSYEQTIRSRRSGEQWSRAEGGNGITRLRIDYPLPILSDPRTFGLRDNDQREKTPAQLLTRLRETKAIWSASIVDGIHVVSMECLPVSATDSTHGVTTWRIDPLKDYSILEVTYKIVDASGKEHLLARSETQYSQEGGRWWPKIFEAVAPRTGVKHTVVFHSAEFDRPNHSLDMTPDIWNLPAGVIVDSRFDPATGLVESGDGRYLGGGVVISEDDWNQVKNQYDYSALQAFWERNSEIGSGPYPKWWAAAGADFGLSAASANPDLWEAYVRRWILRHTPLHPSAGEEATQPLSDEQVTAAWGILKDCRRRAKPILRRMQEQDEAKNAGANAERTDAGGQQELSAPTSAPSGEKTATLRKSPRELTKVPTRYEREINTVFELLKKRLAELLRENQRLYDDKPKVAASVAPSS